MGEPSRPALFARRALAWWVGWVFAAALYLLLIDITDLPELLVGAGAAVLAATGFELAREQGVVGESVRGRWLASLARPLVKVPSDTVIVSAIAVAALVRRKPSQGGFVAVSFACDEDEQHESGRQALAQFAGSIAPNTFVVGIDGDRELVLAHQLHPTKGRDAIDPMGLG